MSALTIGRVITVSTNATVNIVLPGRRGWTVEERQPPEVVVEPVLRSAPRRVRTVVMPQSPKTRLGIAARRSTRPPRSFASVGGA